MDELIIPEYEIKRKYLKPPTVTQITEFVNELGVTFYQFERFYSMPYGVIKQIKGGYRSLPIKFWPIFYEKIVPQYGISFTKRKKVIKSVTKVVTNRLSAQTDPHDRVVSVK